MLKSSSTHYKLNKQLQNSLWLRIDSGQIAFMQSRLNNSTKFHFGNKIITNDLKTNRKQFNQHHFNYNTNNNRNNNTTNTNHKKYNKTKSPHLLDGNIFHLPWWDRCPDPVANKRARSLTQQIQLREEEDDEEQRPTKWIHNNNFASNGTAIRPIWQ